MGRLAQRVLAASTGSREIAGGMDLLAGAGAAPSEGVPPFGSLSVHARRAENPDSPWGKVACAHLAYYANQDTHQISLFTPPTGVITVKEHPDRSEFMSRWLEMAQVAQRGFGISEPPQMFNPQSPWGMVLLGDLAYYANQQTRELSLTTPVEGVKGWKTHPDATEFERTWSDLATQAGQPVLVLPAEPASPVRGRSMLTSNFLRAYAEAVGIPIANTHSLGSELECLIRAHCRARGIAYDRGEGEGFFRRIMSELERKIASVHQQAGREYTIPEQAQYIWTLDCTLQDREMCSILNDAIRSDEAACIGPVAKLAREINRRCVTIPPQPPYPNDWICYRGSGFDERFREFFFPGRKFRQPAFLPTSFKEDTAKDFMRRSTAAAKVLWKINIHRKNKCVNCSLVENTAFPEESEYLFVPYSVFTVHHASWRAGTVGDPHVIELYAATDNKGEPEGLPLAPWG